MVKDREKDKYPIGTPTATVTFDANGGYWEDDNKVKYNVKTVPVILDTSVARPSENPGHLLSYHGVSGWYTHPTDGELFDFTTPITADITLYAHWTFMLTSTIEVTEYLATQTAQAGTVDDPVYLPVQINLGTMTAADSDWRELLDAIETADQYVDLDLSTCAMSGIAFNPGPAVAAGKNKIVSLALPDKATMIVGGIDDDNPAFKHFTALETFSGTGLILIDSIAFCNCESLKMTSLPQGLIYIGGLAFSGCNGLTEITLPEGIIAINVGVFVYCENLARISLPERLDTIGAQAFVGCTSLTDISLPEGLTTIGQGAFMDCTDLTEITLPAGLTEICYEVFSKCTNLMEVTLPAGLNSIGEQAFYECTNLVLTELPAGLRSIGESAFYDCTNLVLTSLPARITSIGRRAFQGCTNLALTELPAGLTEIRSNTFSDCTGLTEIALTAELIEILDYAFAFCTNLELVICLAVTPPWLGADVFYGTHPNLRIEVPAESVDAYKAAEGWSEYADRIFAIGE
jgi:hypothetical protein